MSIFSFSSDRAKFLGLLLIAANPAVHAAIAIHDAGHVAGGGG